MKSIPFVVQFLVLRLPIDELLSFLLLNFYAHLLVIFIGELNP